jgi:hypothetical protein
MDAHRKIMRASYKRAGLRLTAEDVAELAADSAIATRAAVQATASCELTNHRKGRDGRCECEKY